MENEALVLSAGVEDLQDTVANRRIRFIGHVLRLPTSRPASLVIVVFYFCAASHGVIKNE